MPVPAPVTIADFSWRAIVESPQSSADQESEAAELSHIAVDAASTLGLLAHPQRRANGDVERGAIAETVEEREQGARRLIRNGQRLMPEIAELGASTRLPARHGAREWTFGRGLRD